MKKRKKRSGGYEVLRKAIKQRRDRLKRGGASLRGVPEEVEEELLPTYEPIHHHRTILDEREKKGEYRYFVEEGREADFSGMVVEVYPRGALVRRGADDYVLCETAEYLWAKNETPVAAGDEVECVRVEQPYDYQGVIIGVRPRRSVISVPDPDRSAPGQVYEKILAANIDVFIVVDSFRRPEVNCAFIDRCLIVGQREGDKTIVLCINKKDLAEEVLPEVAAYERSVDRLVFTSARTGEGVEELAGILEGKKGVMVGRSGVGKSSLLNRLCPGINIETQPVIHKSGKGVHTTRRCTLFDLPNGGMVIDTPGIKQIALVNIRKSELTWYFPEFYAYREECRFTDCTHSHEPSCGVKRAVEEGRIPEFRYRDYLRMLESLEE